MSRSTIDASRDISSLPSTSSSSSSPCASLNLDLLDNVVHHMVNSCPILDTLRVKNLHPISHSAFSSSLARHEHIRLAFHEPQRWKVLNGKKVGLPEPIMNVSVQGSRVFSEEEAVNLLSALLREMRTVTRVSLYIESTDLPIVQRMLQMLIEADNVQLEVLQCMRREGGKPIEQIVQLIKANAETLRIIGRIGVVEAAKSFSEKIRLDRLSLMTLDLSMDVSVEEIKGELAAVVRSGATFKHLSYTSFTGFDPTDDQIQDFLDSCGVSSLRLTMMHAAVVSSKPDYMIGKIRQINHLEIGEVVDKPTHYNRLVVNEHIYKKVFPNVGHITFFQNWC